MSIYIYIVRKELGGGRKTGSNEPCRLLLFDGCLTSRHYAQGAASLA